METEQRCGDNMVNRVVVLWTLIKVKGYPHVNVPWARASKTKDGGTLNLNDCLIMIQREQESITKDSVDIENSNANYNRCSK